MAGYIRGKFTRAAWDLLAELERLGIKHGPVQQPSKHDRRLIVYDMRSEDIPKLPATFADFPVFGSRRGSREPFGESNPLLPGTKIIVEDKGGTTEPRKLRFRYAKDDRGRIEWHPNGDLFLYLGRTHEECWTKQHRKYTREDCEQQVANGRWVAADDETDWPAMRPPEDKPTEQPAAKVDELPICPQCESHDVECIDQSNSLGANRYQCHVCRITFRPQPAEPVASEPSDESCDAGCALERLQQIITDGITLKEMEVRAEKAKSDLDAAKAEIAARDESVKPLPKPFNPGLGVMAFDIRCTTLAAVHAAHSSGSGKALLERLAKAEQESATLRMAEPRDKRAEDWGTLNNFLRHHGKERDSKHPIGAMILFAEDLLEQIETWKQTYADRAKEHAGDNAWHNELCETLQAEIATLRDRLAKAEQENSRLQKIRDGMNKVMMEVFTFAETECGHPRHSARHGLTGIKKWVVKAKAEIATLRDDLSLLSGPSPWKGPLTIDDECPDDVYADVDRIGRCHIASFLTMDFAAHFVTVENARSKYAAERSETVKPAPPSA